MHFVKCQELIDLCLNLSHFVVYNPDPDDIFCRKLKIIREGMINHLESCKECELLNAEDIW